MNPAYLEREFIEQILYADVRLYVGGAMEARGQF